MAEFGWKSQMKRSEIAALLLRVAEGLDGDGKLRLQEGVAELKVDVPEDVALEVELDIEGDQLELEIELTWSLNPAAREGERDDAAGGPPDPGAADLTEADPAASG